MSIKNFEGAKKKSDGKLIVVNSEHVNRQWFYEDEKQIIVFEKNLERNLYTKNFAEKWLEENTTFDDESGAVLETHDSDSESVSVQDEELVVNDENSSENSEELATEESYGDLSYDELLELAKARFDDIKGRPSKVSLIEKLSEGETK